MGGNGTRTATESTEITFPESVLIAAPAQNVSRDYDPEDDTIPNLLEYALALNPKQINLEGLPVVDIIAYNQGLFATLTYWANPDADDIIYSVEVSGDGGSTWTSGGGATEQMKSSIVEGKREVVERDLHPVDSGGEPNRLLRLTVKRSAI